MKKIIAVMTGIIGVILVAIGVVSKVRRGTAISVIGGADGPTSIFIAGKVGTGFGVSGIVVGVLLVALAVVLLLKMKKQK